MIEEITVKFSTELKPIKTSWKSQLYKYIFHWYYIDKNNFMMFSVHNIKIKVLVNDCYKSEIWEPIKFLLIIQFIFKIKVYAKQKLFLFT